MKKSSTLILTLLLFSFVGFAQRGKDGAGNITVANTIVNIYSPVTANANSGNSTISVGSTAGFAVGDLIMIIQMQGANVNTNNGGATPPWFDPNSSVPTDTSSGYITNYNNCGNHEFAQINSVLSGTSFSLDCGLKFNYTQTGRCQIVRVPRYTTLLISGAGYIGAAAWNGTVGGIAVVEVETNATLSSTPSFSVTGRGFRGGAVENLSTLLGANKFGHVSGVEGAYKGESIVGDTGTYRPLASVFCRGAIANGGGGGTAHNAGGGGGANGGVVAAYRAYGNPDPTWATAWNLESPGFSTVTSSGGGRGGYSFSSNNLNPNTTGPGAGTSWGGDNRRNMGGFGGRPLNYSTGKIFVGGGGGAGDANDGYGTPAGNGGGMVYILCYGNLSGAGTIVADGGAGNNTATGGFCSGRDGAGGGGGGGTVILNVVGTTNLTAATAIFARGGAGGTVNFGGGCTSADAYGPGAGGGGGYIGVTGTLPPVAVTGGTTGVVTGNLSVIRTNFPPNGATRGGAGSTGTLVAARTITATPTTTICVNNTASLTAGTTTTGVTINWFNASAGGSPIGTGSPFTTPTFTAAGTYTLYAGYCDGGTYRIPSVITVITGPTLTVNSPSICSGQSATLTASGATTYTWNTGATTSSIVVSPTVATTYTISGTLATCAATRTTNVTILTAPSLTATPASVCSGQSATLTASGATTYTWNTGATTSSIVVSPTVATNYTVSGSNGSCISSLVTSVSTNSLPSVTSTTATICAGQSATLTAGGASTYTWNTGATTSSIVVSPTVTTNYTVTGNNGTCSNTRTTTVVLATTPTVTASSATICSGASTVLTAGGATSYTWNTGPTTSTVSLSPTTTTNYTVTGSNGTCSNTRTTSIVVNPNPTVAVNSPTLCSGQTTTLTASGASTYTWNPGGLSGSSVTVSPTSNQSYTITATSSLSCLGNTVTTVSVTSTPTVAASSATICPGGTATLTASGATTYTWNPGGATGTTLTVSPVVNTTYTVTGANGNCVSTRTVNVNIGSAISIAVNNPSICAGQTATLTASGATTYTWNTGSNSSSITVNPSTTTSFTISGTVGACNGSQTSTVTVSPNPTVAVANASLCSGNTATLTASGATTYTWNPGGLSGSSVTVSPTSTQSYSITGSNAAGCTNTTSATVSVTATPTLSIPSVTICTGQTATLSASGATSYTWNPGAGTGATFTAAPAANTTYTVNGANGICVTTSTVGVIVGAALSVSINSPTICAGQSVTLTATSSATSYTWNTGANTSTIVVTPSTTTSYSVNGSAGVCNGSGSTTVVVNSVPSVSLAGVAICSGQSATLTASGATTYTWLPSGSSGSVVVVSPATSTNYTVIGTSNGCDNTASADVTVTPTPTLTVNSPTICGGSATLIANGASNYTWTPGGFNTSSIVVTPSITATYTIDGTNGSCLSSITTTVTVNTAPAFTIEVSNPIPFCPGSCTNFSVTSGYNPVTFDFGDATGTFTNSTHCYATIGIYTVNATGTFSSGCIASTNTVITISFLPVNTATFDVNGTQHSPGSVVSITSYGNNGNWNFGDGTNALSLSNPTHIYNTGGTYCIKMVTPTNSVGCADSLTKCIDVIQPISINIPNVFTPNADGINDVFKASGTGVSSFHCTILDRWGLRMSEWDGIGGGWDGYTTAGVAAPSGSYFYIIKYSTVDGKSEEIKGYVSLFR